MTNQTEAQAIEDAQALIKTMLMVGALRHDEAVETINQCLEAQLEIIKGGNVVVPRELCGIKAMMTAIKLKGKWNKQKGERDTEKVKRIYKAMITTTQEHSECSENKKGNNNE